jgi:hypothetical protein
VLIRNAAGPAQSLSKIDVHPGGQHPSLPVHAVSVECVQTTLHVPSEPDWTSFVHAIASSQLVGHPPSHVSPGSTTPFPHTGSQSSSPFAWHPLGQHPSPSSQVTIGGYEHTTLHCDAVPVATFIVQAFPSSQLPGQSPSHVSCGASVVPSLHVAEQSSSVDESHAAGQHPSPSSHAVTSVCAHSTSQDELAPLRASVVQAFPSSQLAGHIVSHVSPGSTLPFPHVGLQSLSFQSSHPALGQQPSPLTQRLTGRIAQWRSQRAAVPVITARSHGFTGGEQLVGQLPSQRSPFSTTPFPHVGRQSGSSSGVQPAGQQSS